MLLFLSYLSICIAFFYQRLASFTYPRFFLFALLCITALANNIIYITIDAFSGDGINGAVLYHLQFGLEGAGFGEYTFWYILGALYTCIALCLLGLLYRHIRRQQHGKTIYFFLSISFVLLSIGISPTLVDISTVYREIINPATTVSYDPTKETSENLPSSEQYPFETYFIQANLTTTTEKQKNLVLIYAEGLEQTYSNETLFPNLTPNLKRLASKGTVFTNITQVDDTGYTIAGMVASQCGIPLVTGTHGNTLQGMDSFLSGATCLGDLLSSSGYHLAYYGGASLTFAGKGLFYTTHKYDEVYGKEELKTQVTNPKSISSWGVHDDALFPILTTAFDRLAASTTPFALATITLETHHPSGVQSQSCAKHIYGNGKNKMLNAVHCSDKMIGSFVDHILASPAADNTIIVIVSDHLGLPNDATKLLNGAPRFNRFLIINPSNQVASIHDLRGSTLDVTPTLLPFLGFSTDVGFGRNLLSPSTTQTELNTIKTNIKRWYPNIKQLWQYPTVSNNITIDTTKEQVYIDNRKFAIPTLITIDADLQTNIFFRFNQKEAYELMAHIDSNSLGLDFYLIERCNVIKQYAANKTATELIPDTDQYCLATGNTTIKKVEVLPELLTIPKAELQMIVQ